MIQQGAISRRVKAGWLAVGWLFSGVILLAAPAYIFVAIAHCLAAPVRRRQDRVQKFRRDAQQLRTRMSGLAQEWNTILASGQITELQKAQFTAAASAIARENEVFQKVAAELQIPVAPTGLNTVLVVLEWTRAKVQRRQKKREALARIVSQIEFSPTFYWDLLLWFLVPYSEELMGDLTEEFQLRAATDGEPSARAWYIMQILTSVRDHCWRKIERWLAIGSLIDFCSRFWK